MNKKTKRLIMLNAPYVLIGLLATNLGEAWRLAIGSNATEKVQALVQTIPQALSNPLPSPHQFDLMVGAVGAGVLRLAVYLKGKNARSLERVLSMVLLNGEHHRILNRLWILILRRM